MPRLPPLPDTIWDEAGALVSQTHGDIYFSRAGGLEESRAVFLAGCGLPEAWSGRARFTIAELGFGTGLNALAAWELWARTRPTGAILHFQSIEAALLPREDAARALAAFPSLTARAERLLAAWPARCAAEQRIWAPEDGFALTLHIGDAIERLGVLPGPVDAWFLDGFSPARNPDMWGDGLYRLVAAKSAAGARLATYSVAGHVRRGLQAAGFTVRRAPGFANKRERLEAQLPGAAAQKPAPNRIAILGGGIAGAAAACAFLRRGVPPILLERASSLAAGASGNPAGLVSPRLDRGETPSARFLRAAYLAALAAYQPLGQAIFNPCGVRVGGLAADLIDDPPLPPEHLAGALAIKGGVLRPVAAIAALAAGADVRCGIDVTALEAVPSGWALRGADGQVLLEAEAVVLAAGPLLARFSQTEALALQTSRGQIEWGRVASAPPPHALTDSAYAAPMGDGVVFGATFDPWADPGVQPAADDASRHANVSALAALAPDIAAGLDPASLSSRASLRATTPDRLPIAGFAPDAPAVLAAFDGLRFGRPAPAIDPPRHAGLYLLGGFGARGLTFAPLLGEAAAAAVLGEPAPFDDAVAQILDPARFLLRSLKRR